MPYAFEEVFVASGLRHGIRVGELRCRRGAGGPAYAYRFHANYRASAPLVVLLFTRMRRNMPRSTRGDARLGGFGQHRFGQHHMHALVDVDDLADVPLWTDDYSDLFGVVKDKPLF